MECNGNIPVTKSVKLSAERPYLDQRAIIKNNMKIRILKFCLNENIPRFLEKLNETEWNWSLLYGLLHFSTFSLALRELGISA